MKKSEIIQLIDRHTLEEGVTNTPLEGLQLYRTIHPVKPILGVYEPSICAIVQGSKRAYLNGTTHIYDENQYLCCTRPLPVEAEVVE
ncbi:MAG: AraC family transcriptional regulator, partial [Symploca sp. SIO2E6]|nr:AraC family transcriptional regulator [Symploca sp. SIO2E6]